jgi:hypothetical protein
MFINKRLLTRLLLLVYYLFCLNVNKVSSVMLLSGFNLLLFYIVILVMRYVRRCHNSLRMCQNYESIPK